MTLESRIVRPCQIVFAITVMTYYPGVMAIRKTKQKGSQRGDDSVGYTVFMPKGLSEMLSEQMGALHYQNVSEYFRYLLREQQKRMNAEKDALRSIKEPLPQ